MTAYISSATYIVIGTTIRLVMVVVVCAAAFVVIVGVVLDDKCEKFFRRVGTWGMVERGNDPWLEAEQRDETWRIDGACERVNQ